jgi:thymidylate synthase
MNSERAYLDLLEEILEHGKKREDRTKIGVIGLFGKMLKFDLREEFPLLTTKKVWFTGVVRELLFFLSGKTDTKILLEKGVKIWEKNTSKEFLLSKGLDYEVGDMGPGYSFQWRHFGAEYEGCSKDYTGKGVDQITNLIEGIKNDPFGRRHIINAWNVADLDKMALPPCHMLCQFYVDEGYLDCMMNQRSADMFLGVPFNIASYSLLTHIIAKLTNLLPRYFIHILGDAHIYSNHVEQVKIQLMRDPYPYPTISIKDFTSIDELREDHFEILNYISHPAIKADMAV